MPAGTPTSPWPTSTPRTSRCFSAIRAGPSTARSTSPPGAGRRTSRWVTSTPTATPTSPWSTRSPKTCRCCWAARAVASAVRPTSLQAKALVGRGGDFNADGDPDLAVVNTSSQNVSVLLGGPGGSFSGPTNLAAGESPSDVAVGDFNGDGDPDLPSHRRRGVGAARRLGRQLRRLDERRHRRWAAVAIAVGDFRRGRGPPAVTHLRLAGGRRSRTFCIGDERPVTAMRRRPRPATPHSAWPSATRRCPAPGGPGGTLLHGQLSRSWQRAGTWRGDFDGIDRPTSTVGSVCPAGDA